MRFTAVLLVFAAAGCFNPRVTDGGFACDPSDPVPCPDGQLCRPSGSGGLFVCTSQLGAPTPPVTSVADMAMDTGGNPGGGDDLAMASPADMAKPPSMPGDMATTTNCSVSTLVINEVQTHGVTALDEWVEIYNPCGKAVSLTGTLVYRSYNGSSDITLAAINAKSVPANGYLLLANSDYVGTTDVQFNAGTGMADSGGGVALRDNNGLQIDSMGWGNATNAFVEGSAATAPSSNSQSMARTPNGTNTHHNSTDFKVATSPTPRAAN